MHETGQRRTPAYVLDISVYLHCDSFIFSTSIKNKEIPLIICFGNTQSPAPHGQDGAMGPIFLILTVFESSNVLF